MDSGTTTVQWMSRLLCSGRCVNSNHLLLSFELNIEGIIILLEKSCYIISAPSTIISAECSELIRKRSPSPVNACALPLDAPVIPVAVGA